MTLKEKVMEMQPECISNYHSGGVCGCPCSYPYLNKPKLNWFVCSAINYCCEDCWNQPFEEQEPIIKEKIRTKSIT